MNILYCGDHNIEDGLLLSILSLLLHVKEPLSIYVLTMPLSTPEKEFRPVSDAMIAALDETVKKTDGRSFARKIDISALFEQMCPEANLKTRFTPFCMLRLYADQLAELPDRILYLDNDVICRKDCTDFYYQNIEPYELVGVLDHYGKWFFRNKLLHRDYINSGVLLLNLKKIRETGLFEKCRAMCREKEMFMPDQSAINKLCAAKKIVPRRFNEQRKLHEDTILQHFTTSFRFFPWLHTLTVKPWEVEKMHDELKLHEYDDLLAEYTHMMSALKAQ